MLILNRSRIAQPAFTARIKRSHPLARGLILAYLPAFGGFRDLVSGHFNIVPSVTLPGNPIDGNRGAALKIKATEHYSVAGVLTPLDTMSTGALLSVFAEARNESNSHRSIISSIDSSTGNGFNFNTDVDNYVLDGFYYGVNNNSTRVLSATSALGTSSKDFMHRIACSYDGTTVSLYSKRILSNSGAIAAHTANASRRTRLLAFSLTSSQASASVIYAWDRELPLHEYQALYDNPWQLIEDRRVWVPTAGAAAGGGFKAAWVRPQSRIIGAGVR